MSHLNSKTQLAPSTLYLVRHGQSETNAISEAGKVQNPSLWNESDLTALGIKQAKLLAAKLQNTNFDAIFSSDFRRAHRTAEIIATGRGIEIATSERLRESSAGNLHQIYSDQNSDTWKSFSRLTEQEKATLKINGMAESFNEAASRFLSFVTELVSIYPGSSILIVSHGALMKSFLMKVGYGVFDDFPKGSIENTGYAIVEGDGHNFHVRNVSGIHKGKK